MIASEVDIMARTLWAEARGEGVHGMTAVAWVIRNRAARDPWPDSVAFVCLQRRQFSCWNDGDPNRIPAMVVGLDTPEFMRALFVTYGVLSGELEDPTNGADHYHTIGLDTAWDEDMESTAVIGNHEFFRAEL